MSNLTMLRARQAIAKRARLENIQHNRHMIGQYDEIEMTERAALSAFRGGWATGQHWNHLAECRNVLMFGACHKIAVSAVKADHEAVREVTRIAMGALTAIRDREQKTGKFGANSGELNALHALVETSRDFWTRQPATLFSQCVAAVRKQVVQTIQQRGAA
ncbi:hypothetical protein [Aromatoleum anaerobium]|uniref:Phage protein n=1 Tax=Aromatoleum anaerobium TaxID=182180 RepID=A0ABX1PN55_9RHOO|nr:hypothetical protein [Aromatoleum anaerobium]MCK0507964.1 hypothetical protein [Aromatoleum anaerobium]